MNVCSCNNKPNIAWFVAASTRHRTVMRVSTPDVSTSTTTHSTVREHPTTPGLMKPNKPVLDLNVTALYKEINNPQFVAGLPEGEAAVVNGGSQVLKINKTGQTLKELYDCQSCNNIKGLLLLGSNLHVIHNNGSIVEIQTHTGDFININLIPDVSYSNHYGSLWSNPSKIPNTDILLLPDWYEGEVFSYNLTSRHKQVHLTRLYVPISVSYSFYNNSTLFVVCQNGRHIVNIYNSSWHLVSSFGGRGTGDGNLRSPYAAIMSSKHTVLVSDYDNNRISVFRTDGVFLHHLLTQSDGIRHPSAISYYKPYLWVVNSKRLYRYMLYK